MVKSAQVDGLQVWNANWPDLLRVALVAVMVGLVSTGCAPESRSSPAPQANDRVVTQPKHVSVGMLSEPKAGIILFPSGGGRGEGNFPFALHAGLTIYDAQGNLLPQIAQRVPTLDNGDWKAFPDGKMEVTWRLRPGVKWHDGTPLTAADFVLGVQLLQDPDLPVVRNAGARLISEAEVVDDATLVIRWSQIYTLANVSGAGDLSPVPRHLVMSLYEGGDKRAFTNSGYWTQDFVGLGPYRLTDWKQGSYLEAAAFDDYFLGRPKIDRVTFHFFSDANSMRLALLAGDIDIVPIGGFMLDHAVSLKNTWEQQGAGTVLIQSDGVRSYRFQFRDPSAPWARDVRVRQALSYLLDRQAIADTLGYGVVAPAFTLVVPEHPVYGVLEQRGLAKYPYDRARAAQLLSDAGWSQGRDSMYRSAAGESLSMEVAAPNKPDNVKEIQAMAAQWRQDGIDASAVEIPDQAANKSELRSKVAGVIGYPMTVELDKLKYLTSRETSNESNRWAGENMGGFSDPRFDRLFDQYVSTLDASQRQGVLADLLLLEAQELPTLHLTYTVSNSTIVSRKGIRGLSSVAIVQGASTWNIHQWDME